MENPIQTTKYVIMIAECEIRGIKSLLMSSPKEMFLTELENPFVSKQLKGKKVDPKFEAEKRSYRTEEHGWKGDLCVPAKCIERCLEEGAKKFKTKRGEPSLVQAVKGSVTVEPGFIPILDGEGKKQIKDFDVNGEKVKITSTKGSVIRYRPEIPEWTLKFRIKWMPSLFGLTEGRLQQILERAGFEGLLDWRPKHGMFQLVRFDVIEEA